MSKPIKQLIRKELAQRLEGVDSLAVVGFAGIDAISTNQMRGRLLEKGIQLMVVKNSLARQAFKDIGLEAAGDLLDGPSAVAFCPDGVIPVVRELLEIKKEIKDLEVKAAILEGEAYGADQILALSKFPTREEAIAKLVSCVLAPGAKLASAVLAPGKKVASLIKAIEEKQGDDGGDTSGDTTEEAA